jgi:hypothetical protein
MQLPSKEIRLKIKYKIKYWNESRNSKGAVIVVLIVSELT